jgi:hypothetical protein
MEAFRRTVADTDAALASLQRPGADERVNAVVETLIGHLKSGDSLLVPVLSGRPGSWSRAHTATIIGIVALRIGMDLDYTHPELSQLGQVALLYEIGAGTAPARRSVEDGARLIGALGPAFGLVADLVLQARERMEAGANGPGVRAPQDAEIVAVAATYAHLARQLPNGPSTFPPPAVKELLRRGRARFPDAILKALIHITVQFPVGAFVRLNSGEVARVVAKNEGLPLRPVVVIAGRRGKQPAEPQRVDLRDNPFLFIGEFLGHEPAESETENRPT